MNDKKIGKILPNIAIQTENKARLEDTHLSQSIHILTTHQTEKKMN